MAQLFAPSLSMRGYYSTHHLWAARHFTRVAKEIEDRHEGKSVFDITHRSYVTSAIFSAVAFLDSAVNELLQDARDDYTNYIGPLGDKSIKKLGRLWSGDDAPPKGFGKKSRVSRWGPLQKCHLVLFVCGKPVIDKSLSIYNDARLVTKLRNAVIHFSPKTRTTELLDKLDRSLKHRFTPNRLMAGSANPFFPSHCLGHGCAEWAG